MHRLLTLAASAVLGFTPVAFAADLPLKAPAVAVPAPYDWTGFYLGGNAGYGWGGSTGNTIAVLSDPAGLFTGYTGFQYPNLSPNGGIGGGQIGYNYQTGNWVLGAVADFQFANLRDSGLADVPAFATFLETVQTHSAKIDWFGTVRGRIGWAFDKFLPYISGGLAYGKVSSTLTLTAPATGFLLSGEADTVKAGWTVGGGFEYALNNKVSFGVDYIYMDLGHQTVLATNQNFFAFPAVLAMDHHFTANVVRGAVNFRF
jgi:outer membrane immunogenic protein